MVVDTHAHVYKDNYDNVDEVINNAKDKGVTKIINCAESLSTSKEIISLYKKHSDILECAVGVHPEYSREVKEEDLIELKKLVKSEKVIAIGEIGLDYHYDNTDKKSQIGLFTSMLDLATKYNLPVIVHSRDATEDTINILKTYNLKGIVHCFSGSYEVAMEYIKMGYLIGIGGIVTFKNCKLIEVIEKLDLKNIVFETDCPYLTPEPYRKYKNEPAYVIETMKFVGKKLGKTLEELEYISSSNIKAVFDIKE